MEQRPKQTIAELEATLVTLHRREMRLRSRLKSALVSPKKRQDARLELEILLEETRQIEKQIGSLHA